jgi:hypothetical protein
MSTTKISLGDKECPNLFHMDETSMAGDSGRWQGLIAGSEAVSPASFMLFSVT